MKELYVCLICNFDKLIRAFWSWSQRLDGVCDVVWEIVLEDFVVKHINYHSVFVDCPYWILLVQYSIVSSRTASCSVRARENSLVSAVWLWNTNLIGGLAKTIGCNMSCSVAANIVRLEGIHGGCQHGYESSLLLRFQDKAWLPFRASLYITFLNNGGIGLGTVTRLRL